MTPRSADELQRAHLEARRAYLVAQVEALREQALELWRRAHRIEGEEAVTLEELAMDAEAACMRVNAALMAIDDELGEE